MKITGFSSSTFNLQNIKDYCFSAYNSIMIAKVRAVAYVLIACTVIKSSKMGFKAYMYPKGWDLSNEERNALVGVESLKDEKGARFPNIGKEIMDAKENVVEGKSTKEDFSTYRELIIKPIIETLKSDPNPTVNQHVLGMRKLYDRTAQLLPWPDYVKSLW